MGADARMADCAVPPGVDQLTEAQLRSVIACIHALQKKEDAID
jgi:hypothetical protein